MFAWIGEIRLLVERLSRGSAEEIKLAFKGVRMNKFKEFVLKHFEVSLIILILVGIFSIAFLVHYKFSFLNFFFLPVILSGYFLGKQRAVLTAIFCILLMVLYFLFFNLLFGTGPGLSLIL